MIRTRHGMSLVEVMVAIAILLALAVVMVPAMGSFLQLEQRRVAQELATTYGYLHDEAVLQNVTYRIAYHIDENYYVIESGAPDALIFDDPDKRQAWEQARDDRMRSLSEDERAQALASEEPEFTGAFGADAGGHAGNNGNLPVLQSDVRTRRDLPSGTVFGGVYTPQYGEFVEPDPVKALKDGPKVVYSHIFANGFTEQTVIHIVDASDPTQGYTIAVEPLSGKVTLIGDLKAFEDFRGDVPDEAPELP